MEHLETDVMRFLAILALCLVAIFALVQSMPLDATPPAPSAVDHAERVDALPPAPAKAVATAAPVATFAVTPDVAPDPTPEVTSPATPDAQPAPAAAVAAPAPEALTVRIDAPRPARVATTEAITLVMPPRRAAPRRPSSPAAASSAAAPAATPARVSAPPPPEALPAPAEPQAVTVLPDAHAPSASRTDDVGFTLRFESDEALRALVARDEVALYALADGKAWRAMWFDDYLGFRPAQVPHRYHEMNAATVPDAAVSTLRRRVAVDPAALRWGVTLPASTSAELDAILAVASGGELVIDANAQLRLEPGS